MYITEGHIIPSTILSLLRVRRGSVLFLFLHSILPWDLRICPLVAFQDMFKVPTSELRAWWHPRTKVIFNNHPRWPFLEWAPLVVTGLEPLFRRVPWHLSHNHWWPHYP